MKKHIYFLLIYLLLIPSMVLASSTYDQGVKIANKYIYDFQDYSRYIKVTGQLPYVVSNTNMPMYNAIFTTGGFLNEREYEMSISNNSSYLAPGIGYWLVDRKILDVKAETFVNPNVESGIRVTEFTRHDVKVKGSGTKTNPWYFTDGYIVKVGSSDQSLGSVIGGCDHVQDGGSCAFTLSYDSNQGINTDNCKSLVESKGGTLTQSGNTLTISNVHSDISCLVDFGVSNKCLEVSFDNAGGTGGMNGKHIYFKYGYGWFSDSLCLTKIGSVSKPTKTGNIFEGYKYNGITIINNTPSLSAGIRENIRGNITATANWRPCPAGTYLSGNSCLTCQAGTYSLAGSSSCTNCSAGTYQPNAGKGSCINCPAGTYQPNTKQTSCIKCVAGSYQDQPGKTSCKACAGGKTSTAGATAVCTTNCTNSEGVASWKTPAWNTNNTMTNLCTPNSCINTHRLDGNKCVLNKVEWVFNYTGGVQDFPIPYTGTYKLEVWGAQGGGCGNSYQGYGGYASGTKHLTAGGKLYVVVGGHGGKYAGGYNGGGNGAWGPGESCGVPCGPQWAHGGGGATHIATRSGVLSSLSSYRGDILLVAGGGGGNGGDSRGNGSECFVTGGSGGGEYGGTGIDDVNWERSTLIGYGASQSGPGSTNNWGNCGVGSFGQGGNYCDQRYGGAGGGGGWYGGGGSSRGHAGAGGGSGYIDGVSNGSMSNGVRSGHGQAKITFINSN